MYIIKSVDKIVLLIESPRTAIKLQFFSLKLSKKKLELQTYVIKRENYRYKV